MNLFKYFTPKSETCYLTENMTIRQALEKFDKHRYSVVPVISETGIYLTTVSEGDVLRYIKNCANFDLRQAENVPVMKIEKYRPYTACTHEVEMDVIFRLALEQNFVPVIDDLNSYIGIVKRSSILHQLYQNDRS